MDITANTFVESHVAEVAWIRANSAKNDFAASLGNYLDRNGFLSERQLAAVQRNLVSFAPAPTVDSNRLEKAFISARSNGLKWPKILLGDIKISPAGETSANAGALYVKDMNNTYLGKVMGGKFMRSRDCGSEQAQVVVDLLNDPMRYAEAYGKRTGVCCCCGRELTNDESIERGIGPICAAKFGW